MISRLICLGLFVVAISVTVVSAAPSTTEAPKLDCSNFSSNCDACVKNAKCIFCYADNKCKPYPMQHLIPKTEDCDLSQTRWGTCIINYKALLIAMATIAGILLLSCTGCIVYCCCCRGPSGRTQRRWAKDDAKDERKKAERQMKQDQRKTERKAKNDEIRRKYGLQKDDPSQYHHLDDD